MTQPTRQPTTAKQVSPVRHLNQLDLARRWRISPRTLERWRWLGQGPAYLKLGGSVAYRIEDVETYEAAQLKVAGTGRKAPEPNKAELFAMGRRA